MEINLVSLPTVKLTRENYQAWCESMKTYLLRQDLWDVVEKLKDPSSSIMSKNAAALRDVRESCGPEALSIVKDAHSAKDAWDQLANMYGSSSSSSLENSGPSHSSSSHNSGSSGSSSSNNSSKFFISLSVSHSS
ncbi:hypothetical protein L6164_008611 [Bauhinia variegata]|uniref:Uncharacterized protein n=1 Tax=Bauhinia variegata TaxID=167791 RepID=A0ACB9PGA0_BAUVA|nr:hypothetical protein L6164_008611 [Bauhinia variegata]